MYTAVCQYGNNLEFGLNLEQEDEDYSKAMNDPDFLQRVISSLPGVDPNSDAVRSAFDNLTKDNKEDKDKKKEEKK